MNWEGTGKELKDLSPFQTKVMKLLFFSTKSFFNKKEKITREDDNRKSGQQ